MNFSAIPIETASGRLLRLPLKLIPGNAVLPVMQGRLRGKKWIAGSSTHGCWLGSYEFAQQRLFEAAVEKGSVIFDVGAHAGFLTLLASQLTGPAGKVIAFEPLPENMDFLRRHLALNRVSNVTAIEAAVSDRSGCSRFAPGPTRSQGRLAASGSLEVRTVRLDDLICHRVVPPPAFIKIDVEGAEYAVLAGAYRTLSHFRPTLLLSTHGLAEKRQCVELLVSLNYRIETIDARSIQESRELFATG